MCYFKIFSLFILGLISLLFVINRKKKQSSKYVQKVTGLPFLGVALDFVGKTSEENFKQLIDLCEKFDGQVRGNLARDKIILTARPEDIEVNDC